MSTEATTGRAPAPRIVRIGHAAAPLVAAAATSATALVHGPRVAWVPFGDTLAPEAWQQPLSALGRASVTLQTDLAARLWPADVVRGALVVAAVLAGLYAAALVVVLRRAGLRSSHALLLALVAAAAPLALWQATSPLGLLPLTLGSLGLLATAASPRAAPPGSGGRWRLVAATLLVANVAVAWASHGLASVLQLLRAELGLIGLALLAGHLVARRRHAAVHRVASGALLLLALGAWTPPADRLAVLLPWLWWLVATGLVAVRAERPAQACRWATAGLVCWVGLSVAQAPWAERQQAAAAVRTWADDLAALADPVHPLVQEDSARGQLVSARLAARRQTGALVPEAVLRSQVEAGRTPLLVDAALRDRWRWAGVGFAAPTAMVGRPLRDLLEAFPADTLVLAAISREAASHLTTADWQALGRIGLRTVDAGQPRAHVVIGMTGARAAGLHVADPQRARVDVQPGDPIGRLAARAPIDARIEATTTDVALTLRGRTLHAGRGLLVAFWTRRGELLTWRSGRQPAHLYGTPLGRERAVLSQAIASLPCVEVAPGPPVDITAAARAGGLGLVANGPATLEVTTRGPEGPPAGSFAWIGDDAPANATLRILDEDRVRVEFAAPVRTGTAVRRRITEATASATRPLTVCGAWRVGEAFDPASGALRVDMGPGDVAYLSDGWHDREHDGTGHFRWMATRQAGWIVALRDGAALEFGLDAQTADPPQPGDAIGLTVNEHRLPPQRIGTRRAHYRWSIPAALTRRGVNGIVIETTRTIRPADRNPEADGRTLGLAVHGWSLVAPGVGDPGIE